MRALIKDKSPGPDGITNRMLTGGGEVFTGLLHDFLSSLCLHETQPRAWELSLTQPIYKGGNKLKTDPASFRGIYLSSALAKLFEGLLLHRLTQYTEAHDTLTPNQLGTRPGRQTHDAIYSLLAIIQRNWTLRESLTAAPTPAGCCTSPEARPSSPTPHTAQSPTPPPALTQPLQYPPVLPSNVSPLQHLPSLLPSPIAVAGRS